MSEFIATPMVSVKVTLRCQCGGEMRPTGGVLASFPAQYPHSCSTCGATENSAKMYPCIEHREAP